MRRLQFLGLILLLSYSIWATGPARNRVPLRFGTAASVPLLQTTLRREHPLDTTLAVFNSLPSDTVAYFHSGDVDRAEVLHWNGAAWQRVGRTGVLRPVYEVETDRETVRVPLRAGATERFRIRCPSAFCSTKTTPPCARR